MKFEKLLLTLCRKNTFGFVCTLCECECVSEVQRPSTPGQKVCLKESTVGYSPNKSLF